MTATLSRLVLLLGVLTLFFARGGAARAEQNKMMIRISEIEIHPGDLEKYKAILKEEAEASVRLEPGVIAIFPMFQQKNPTACRIVEIYIDRQAYESHLKTAHFLHYKTATSNMVKSLNLVDMEGLDEGAMQMIFRKLGSAASPPESTIQKR